MKSMRFPVFSVRSVIMTAVVTAASGTAYGQTYHFDGTSSDWSLATAWQTAASGGSDPSFPPGVASTSGFNATFGTAALTGARTVNLNGDYTVGTLATANLDNLLTLQGGGANHTLKLNSGINHVRGGLTIGSITDGQKVPILLGGSQSWTSATTSTGTLQAIFILNDVSIGSGGNQTLTLTGSNTGTKIDGAISDGAGVLSLTKNGSGSGSGPADSTWTINGPVSYSGPTTVQAGKLRLKNTVGLNSNLVTMSSNTLLELTVGGATGMSNAKLEGLLKTGTFPITTSLELNNLGPIFLNTTGPGEFKLTKLGAPELTLFGVSSRNSLTAINAGILRIRDLQPGGVPSSIGSSSKDAANLTFGSGARLIYDGPAASTDRLFTYTGSLTIESAGSGPLQFTDTGTLLNGTASTRTLTLIGSNHGNNRIRSNLGTNVATSITKRGGGSWTILGPNVFTGTTRVDEGTLTYDFSAGDPFQSATILLNGGMTILRGTGATAKSITTLNLGTPFVSSSHFKLENGLALSVTSMTGNSSQRNDLIDLSGNVNNSLTVGALAGTGNTLANVNGIVMTNGTTGQGRASTVLRAQDGTYGFLALSGGTTGTAVKAGPLTQRTPGLLSMTSDATNYLLKAGDYTATSGQNLVFSTAVFDSSDGAIKIDVGAEEIKPSGQGKALLFTGDNNVTFTGNFGNDEAGDDTAIWFHNYLETGFSLNLDVGLGTASQTVIFGGSGLTLYSGTGFVGNFLVNDGVFRFTKDQAIPLTTNSPTFKIGNGAVLEVGARLQFVGNLDLVKKVGGDPGNIRFYGDAGLSAYTETAGGKRIAYFSTVEYDVLGDPTLVPQPLTWGSSYFLTISESEPANDGDNAFKLSSDVSNATIEVQNTIYLNGKVRTLDVADGSATIDARMSGSLMGLATPGDTASGIVKKGPGTLQLTGVNFYKGETRVMEGTLMVIGEALDVQSRLWIDSGAKFFIDPNAINGNAVHVAEVYIDGVQQFGTITHPSIIGGGTLISDAPITPYGQWVISKNLGTTESAPTHNPDLDGIRNLMEYAVGTEPKIPNGSVLSITGNSPRQIKFNHASGRTDIIFALDSSPDLASPWTTIARSTGGAAFTSAVANVVVSEVSNQVTVTDNRTPAATVMFYRLRAEK